jgi:HrpA-like RNA helicase|tara:strand:- start:327 stop:797 length:471 start_codon:yes stop_codon:yes gene_type:complete
LCALIAGLVPYLVERTIAEDGLGCTVLVFLPTYFLIETCHRLLSHSLPEGVPQYVLHSSVDIEDCMVALRGEDNADARVVLGSAIAESSVTMARVTHVVDTCRACEIHYTPSSGESSPHIVWTSRAQSQQRAGRTGRTNNGTVWRVRFALFALQLA